MRHAFLTCFLLVATANPSLGHSKAWKHKESGITLPDRVGDLRRGERQDLGANLNIMVQYGPTLNRSRSISIEQPTLVRRSGSTARSRSCGSVSG